MTTARASSGWLETGLFAAAAAVAIQVARLAAGFPDDEPTWFARNVGLFVLPFLAAYFAHRRRLLADVPAPKLVLVRGADGRPA